MENAKDFFESSSQSSPSAASIWFSGLNLNNIQVLYVYNADLEKIYDAALDWLRNDKFRSLVFLEEHSEAINRLLSTKQGKHLMEDAQVAVHLITEHLSELSDIVLPYSLFSFSVSYFNPYDDYGKGRFAEIKSLIAFFSNYHRSSILGYAQGGLYFFNNFFNNILKLPNSYNGASLSGKFKGLPAIICGAGPSLDKNFDVLSKLHSRALIFAGATAFNALNAKGISPHIVVGIDPNPA
ncbi:MAG: motility associated factor glycosyltransferase family protein, partial [Parachlamydiaceae bacterium]|nr:motility associated factor glycosyltransferase family protein [Parachlamydiaceae bacterium]